MKISFLSPDIDKIIDESENVTRGNFTTPGQRLAEKDEVQRLIFGPLIDHNRRMEDDSKNAGTD